ncbi:MAG: N-acetyl-D-Glu racemase DgcA [Methyloligellaceae bacterium]
MPELSVLRESWPIRGTFAISRGSRTEASVVVAQIRDLPHTGRGECVPYARYGESIASVCAQIEGLAGPVAAGMTREGLQDALPPGAARNALDCALWDLEAKRAGKRVWELAGLPAPEPLTSAYTLSLDTPEAMRASAESHAERPLLKVKLSGPGDLERVRAVRQGAPGAAIIVDANEGWTVEEYIELAPARAKLGVKMIEQPLPADNDAALGDMTRPVPVCADEACHDRASLPRLKGRYDIVNIKLDKTGGLTEALALKREAERSGVKVMVGCMLGTSLSMAPAVVAAQGAAIADLDGPLLLEDDRDHGLRYAGSRIYPPDAALWG